MGAPERVLDGRRRVGAGEDEAEILPALGQRLEILAAAGWYRLIATLCNGLALPREPWAAHFPA